MRRRSALLLIIISTPNAATDPSVHTIASPKNNSSTVAMDLLLTANRNSVMIARQVAAAPAVPQHHGHVQHDRSAGAAGRARRAARACSLRRRCCPIIRPAGRTPGQGGWRNTFSKGGDAGEQEDRGERHLHQVGGVVEREGLHRGRLAARREQEKQEAFFFEKKKQKAVYCGCRGTAETPRFNPAHPTGAKVFWFFFSKKNRLLAWLQENNPRHKQVRQTPSASMQEHHQPRPPPSKPDRPHRDPASQGRHGKRETVPCKRPVQGGPAQRQPQRHRAQRAERPVHDSQAPCPAGDQQAAQQKPSRSTPRNTLPARFLSLLPCPTYISPTPIHRLSTHPAGRNPLRAPKVA